MLAGRAMIASPLVVFRSRPRFPAVRARLVAFVLASAALVSAACDRIALTAPSESTITLFSNTTIVPVNGTAEITATVIESAGTPVHNGTLVTFTTTVGTLDPPEARTNNGKATVRLFPGNRSGRAIVRAFSGGATSEDLTIDVGGAAAGRVALSASPTTVSAAGGTSTLLAVVFDVDGNRLPGVPVSFTATNGTIAETTVVTDGNGEARTTITTSRDTTITATAGGRGGDGGAPITAQVTITAVAPPTVSVSVTTTTPTVGQPVVFTVTAAPPTGGVLRNVTIDFGDRTSQSLGTPSQATTVSHVYGSPGTYTVTVRAEDTTGSIVTATTTVVVAPTVPILVSVTFAGTNAAAGIQVGEPVQFTAAVDRQNNPSAIQSVTYDFGDGTTETGGLTRTHTYAAAGSFTVIVTVRLADGTTGTAQTIVQVVAATTM
jgi:PKD repeat protein